jgi:transcriptional regulator with GAF, ATPase, and Fis domain
VRFFPEEGEAARLRPGEAVPLGPGEDRLLLVAGGDAGEARDLVGPLLELAPRLWACDPEAPPLEPILDALRTCLGASWGALARPGEGDDAPEVLATAGERPPGTGDHVSRSVLAELAETEGAVYQAAVRDNPALDSAASIPSTVRAVVAARLVHGEEQEGVVYLESPAKLARFQDTDRRLLDELCAFVAGALAQAREARGHERRSQRLGELYRRSRAQEHDVETMVAEDPATKRVLREVAQVAPTPTTVLILGETGAGKELMAQAIHQGSPRRQEPFVPVNCAAIPAELVESTLFGHAEGAFTGAAEERPGVFELADGGTLFLDELAELPLPAQAKLLRVLEGREVVPVGATEPRPVDVRVIAGTHADLEARAEAGEFRQDLYFRLAVFVLRVPPLRARPKDLPALAARFLGEFAARTSRAPVTLAPEAEELLLAHAWPGNVRELRNVLEQAMVREDGEVLMAESLHLLPGGLGPDSDAGPADLATARAHFERDFLARALAEEGSVDGAKKRLGISQSSLYAKAKAYGLDLTPYRRR